MTPPQSAASSSTSSLVNDGDATHKYMRMGIGGAGNYRKGSTVADSLPPPSMPSKNSPRIFTSGIGGAGNVHLASERSHITFEEEIARSRAIKRRTHQRVSFGIGGAGNKTDSKSPSASDSSSNYSKDPLPYGAVDVLRRKLFSRKESAASESSSNNSIGDVSTTS